MALSSNIVQGLVRITKLDQVIRQELASKAQLGGISTSFSPTDDLVGDLAVIEESLSQFNLITRMHRERKMRYRDYDSMDNYGDVSVALDIYAEEASQNDLIKETNLWVTGDPNTVQLIEEMFDRIRLRVLLFGMARQLAKFGDLFIAPRYTVNGVSDLLYLPPDFVERVGLGLDKVRNYKLESQLKQISPRKDGVLLPWECVHFRLISFGFSTIYGRSIIEAARKRWLHLKLLEDSVAIYRLNRAVERLIFYIDVGAASPTEAMRIVQQYKRKFGNKRSYINPSTSEFEQQYDPHNMLENYFWPVNSATERSKIDKLPPPPDQGQLQDLDHFNEKLYIALGIPRDFLTGETTGNWNSRESLALQDIRFSRKLHRLQEGMLEGIRQLCVFHLAVVLGDAEAAAKARFELHMADVSKIARQQYDQVLLNRIQVLTTLNDMGMQMSLNRDVFLPWMLENYFPDLPKDMIPQVMIPDQLLAQASVDVATANNPPAAAPAKPAAKKKKKTNEAVINMIMRDIKANPLLENGLADSISRIANTTTPSVKKKQNEAVVDRQWLDKLVEAYPKPKAPTILVESK